MPEIGEWTGAAYIFARSGGVWTQRARLIDRTGWDGGDGGAEMGESVAVDDGTVVVGEPYAVDGDNIWAGRALVYTQGASGWQQDAILRSPDEASGLFFGSGLDLEGGTLAVGQVGGWRPTNEGGSVFVYERDGATWEVQTRLRARDSASDDSFGDAVSVYGDMIAVGNPGDGSGSVNKGAAYVFLRAGDTWTQRVKLAPGPLDSDARLGDAVAIGADHLLFGAPYQSTSKGENSGVVWAYSGLAG